MSGCFSMLWFILSWYQMFVACHDIDQWPEPRAGDELNLPLMGTVIQTRIPCALDKLTGNFVSPRQPLPVSS